MNRLETIRAIAAEYHLEALGVCAFDVQARPLLPCRAKSRLPEQAQTVITVLFPYAHESDAPRNISRYACVPDYHNAAGEVLRAFATSLEKAFEGEHFEPFIDNSPLPEVACAVAAGLGVRGDHGLLISDAFGSYVFIGCVVTTLDLPLEREEERTCLHCGACEKACPGVCLPSANRDMCVSALTQKKGELSREERARIRVAGSLWGCDVCQEVCPMNRDKRVAPHPCFDRYDPWLSEDSLSDLTDKAYGWRGEAVLRRNLGIM